MKSAERQPSEHTPGPWRIELTERGHWEVVAEATVCRVVKFSATVDLADASLVAAAPDLADSLTEMVALYDGTRDMLGPDVRHKLARAEAALAKAGITVVKEGT